MKHTPYAAYAILLVTLLVLAAMSIAVVNTAQPWHMLGQVSRTSTDTRSVDAVAPFGIIDRATTVDSAESAQLASNAISTPSATTAAFATNTNALGGRSSGGFCRSDGTNCPSFGAGSSCSCTITTVPDSCFSSEPNCNWHPTASQGACCNCPAGYVVTGFARKSNMGAWNKLVYKCERLVTSCTC